MSQKVYNPSLGEKNREVVHILEVCMKFNFKKKEISRAVGALVAASAVGFTGSVYAEADESESADDAIEQVVVTGSRIKRAVQDNATPVTIIDASDLQISGYSNVADVLRNTTYNSFGSYRERSGSSFQQIALVDLRGLGPDRTAVLINGRRVPGNPFTGSSSVDLNSIPLSAVERIEILRDSASAVYGADALGGVINFVMRDNYDGAELQIGMTRPSAEGADEQTLKFLFGASSDRGKIIASAEYYKRDRIYDRDRQHSSSKIEGTGFGDVTGISVGGNTGFTNNFSDAWVLGECDTSLYAGTFTTPFGVPGEGCGFAYADISVLAGDVERFSTFVDASYEVSDSLEIYVENRYSRIDSFGRYAPAVGFFGVDEPTRIANGLEPIAEANGEAFSAFHRFVGHGPRDDISTRDEFDFVLGAQGTLLDEAVSFDIYARHYFYSAAEFGNTYVIQSILEELAATGAYDVVNPTSPDNAAAVAASSATLTRDLDTKFNQIAGSLTGSAFDLPYGTVSWAVGAEWAEEEYNDNYDKLREAGNIIGSAGNSAAGDRDRKAAFAEVLVPLYQGLEIGAALRYDDYSDFGSSSTLAANLRYQPEFADWLVLRASFNEGFKAPSLTNLYSKQSQSFDGVTDFPQCESQNIEPVDCPSYQVENYTGGNPALGSEEADAYNVGLVITPPQVAGLSFSFDYYEVQSEDRATSLSLGQLIDFAAAGNLPPGTSVVRGASGADGALGRLVRIDNVITNAALLDIAGYDIQATYINDFEFGALDMRLEYSHFDSYEFQSSVSNAPSDFMGTGGYPEDRVNANILLIRDSITVNYSMNYISDHGGGETSDYDSYMTHDVAVEYRTRFDLDVVVGVSNFTDQEPLIDEIQGYTPSNEQITYDLYDLAGRRTFVRLTYNF